MLKTLLGLNTDELRTIAQENGEPAYRGSQLAEFDFCGLLAAPARVVLDLEGDLVALSQAGRTGVRKRRAVDENVLLAIVRRDEAKATGVVEAFDSAVEAHGRYPFPIGVLVNSGRKVVTLRSVFDIGKVTCS